MKYILKLSDMAYERQDAIDRCNSLGKKFIEHFDKIYKEPKSQAVNHWCNEMQGWLNDARNIRLRQNKKPLNYTDLIDWFFVIGSSSDALFNKEDEVDRYEEFLSKISKYDFNVYNTIKDVFNINN